MHKTRWENKDGKTSRIPWNHGPHMICSEEPGVSNLTENPSNLINHQVKTCDSGFLLDQFNGVTLNLINPVLSKFPWQSFGREKKSTTTDEAEWFNIGIYCFQKKAVQTPNASYLSQTISSAIFLMLYRFWSMQNSDSYNGDFHEYLDQRIPRLFNTRLNASLDGIGLTREQKKMANKLSNTLECSLRKQLWESYLAGPTADRTFPLMIPMNMSPLRVHPPQYWTRNLGLNLIHAFLRTTKIMDLTLLAAPEGYATHNPDYSTHQFSQPQGLENTRPVTPSSSRCIPQSSTSARQPSWSSKEYDLALERFFYHLVPMPIPTT